MSSPQVSQPICLTGSASINSTRAGSASDSLVEFRPASRRPTCRRGPRIGSGKADRLDRFAESAQVALEIVHEAEQLRAALLGSFGGRDHARKKSANRVICFAAREKRRIR